MERITVWTKQHRAVLEQLEQVGRYTAKREYVLKENEDCSRFVLEAYNWLVKHSPLAAQKPGSPSAARAPTCRSPTPSC